MESEGVPGAIQISAATYQLIKDDYVCEARGLIPVKGKGDLETYLLISRRADIRPTTALEVGGVLLSESTSPAISDT
jgi:class 3 adenylate cyclase